MPEKKTNIYTGIMKMTEKRKEQLFLLACLLVAIFRLVLAFMEPIWAITTGESDDALMVRLGDSLSRLRWLGPYDHKTLVKGIAFPAVLMLLRWTHIPLTFFFQLLWTMGSFLLTQALKPVLKNRLPRLVIFTLLALHPLLSNEWTGIRVYRNGLTPGQVLLIMAGLFGLFLRFRARMRTLLSWGLLSSFSILFFYYTREDRVWLYPFIVIVSLVVLVLMLKGLFQVRSEEKLPGRWLIRPIFYRVVLLLLPVVFVTGAHAVFSVINDRLYGEPIVNEFEEGNFPRALQALYIADTGDALPLRVSVTREKIEKLSPYSPALQSIEEGLLDLMEQWGRLDQVPEDGEVEDGWFLWAFRDAVANGRYHDTLSSSEAFYGQLADELEDAMARGELQKKMRMPSALMAQLHDGYLRMLPKKTLDAMAMMARMESAKLRFWESDISKEELIGQFERVTNNRIYASELRSAQEMAGFQRVYRILNLFSWLYLTPAVPFFFLALAAFLFYVFTVLFIRKYRTENHVFMFLILLSMLLSLLVFSVVIAYNDIASCPTINIGYMVGGYGLMAAWEILTLVFSAQLAFQIWKMKISGKNRPEGV